MCRLGSGSGKLPIGAVGAGGEWISPPALLRRHGADSGLRRNDGDGVGMTVGGRNDGSGLGIDFQVAEVDFGDDFPRAGRIVAVAIPVTVARAVAVAVVAAAVRILNIQRD